MKTRAHKGLCMFMNHRRGQIIDMAPHDAKQCAIAMHSTFFDIMRRHCGNLSIPIFLLSNMYNVHCTYYEKGMMLLFCEWTPASKL